MLILEAAYSLAPEKTKIKKIIERTQTVAK